MCVESERTDAASRCMRVVFSRCAVASQRAKSGRRIRAFGFIVRIETIADEQGPYMYAQIHNFYVQKTNKMFSAAASN
jgi:hypothetical protein